MKLAARDLRIAVGVAVMIAATLAFAGSVIMIPQMGPSVLSVLATGAWVAVVAVLVFTVLTLLFGRVYCGALCPLGIVQDFIAGLTRRKGKGQPDKNRKVMRYSILTVTAGLLLAGWVLPARLLEPFTLFGRMVSGFVIPTYTKIMPGAAGKYVGTEAGIAAGVVVLLVLVVLVVRNNRVFCTSICPVGALLGLFAKVGVFRLSIDSEKCIRCGKCARSCPSGCIDLKHVDLDNERCVRCMNCTSECPEDAVKWKRRTAPQPATDLTTSAETPPRRKFLLGLGGAAVASFGAGRLFKPGGIVPLHIKPGIFPPGAGSVERFSSKCTGCLLCVNDCSGKVIMPPDASNPTVHLDYTKGMCEFNCNNCSQVCPTGAIMSTPIEKKKRLRIGTAVFYETRCIAAIYGTHCGACAEHCPTGAVRMVMKTGFKVPIPEVTEALCIGCGNCSWPCPVRPERAITVSPVPVQTLAEDPEEHFKKMQEQLTPPPAPKGEWLI